MTFCNRTVDVVSLRWTTAIICISDNLSLILLTLFVYHNLPDLKVKVKRVHIDYDD